MEITVTVHRSEQWVKDQRIARGENVPTEIKVDVEVASLSQEVRVAILKSNWNGNYCNVTDIVYDRDYAVCSSGWGREHIEIDSDQPNAEDINNAFLAALARIEAKKAQYATEKAAREVRERALAAEWAALPLAKRASVNGVCYCMDDGKLASSGTVMYDTAILKQHAPEAWDEANQETVRLRQAVSFEKAKSDRMILADFLTYIPQDALRGALKAMMADNNDVDDLRKKIEDASPQVVIFKDDEEDE